MPRLVDDPRYLRALVEYLRVHEELHDAYRRRLAEVAQVRGARLLAGVGGEWGEASAREAFDGWDQEFVDISLEYITEALLRSGQVEVAKRLGELREQVGDEWLPPEIVGAMVELEARGRLAEFVDVPVDDEVVESLGGGGE